MPPTNTASVVLVERIRETAANRIANITNGSGQFDETYSALYRVWLCGKADANWILSEGTTAANIVKHADNDTVLPSLFSTWNSNVPAGVARAVGNAAICTGQRLIRGPVGPYEFDNQSQGSLITDKITCGYEFQFDFKSVPVTINNPQNQTDIGKWEAEISIGSHPVIEAAERAVFLGAFINPDAATCRPCPVPDQGILVDVDNDCVTLTKNKCMPVMNAAGQRIAGIENQRCLKVLTISTFHAFANDALYCVEGAVNNKSLDITIPSKLYSGTFPAGTLKLDCVPQVFETQIIRNAVGVATVVKYWRRTYSLLFDPRGHFFDIRNEGTARCTKPAGRVDECCEPDDATCFEPIRKYGKDVTENVLLDLSGDPLACDVSPWFLRYAPDVTDMATLEGLNEDGTEIFKETA